MKNVYGDFDHPKIIIIGTDHHNTLGIIRSFGEKGLYPILFLYNPGFGRTFITYCKYIQRIEMFNNYAKVVDLLMMYYVHNQLKPVVICAEDSSISIIDKNYNLLKDKFLLPNAGAQGRINYYLSKSNMQKVADKVGLKYPSSWIINGTESVLPNVKFPCISKPYSSIDGGKKDIHVNYNLDELKHNIHLGKSYIIQEFIEKDYELNMVALSYNHGHSFIIPGVIRKIREYPVNSGSSSFSVLDDCKNYPELDLDKIKAFVKEIGYEGLFSIEFVVKNGVAFFLEINMRNDGNGYVPTSMNMNLHYIWCQYLLGEEIGIPHTLHTPHYFMADVRDWIHVLKRRVSLKIWLQDLRRTNCYLLYNVKDKNPFFAFFKKRILDKLNFK